MSITRLEFPSFRPRHGPVERTIDDDDAAARLSDPAAAVRSAVPVAERAH
jgi:hypothetical protein